MGRKQVTYARKRNRNRVHNLQESKSSPLEDISDPEQYLTHPEMARRILKRSRRSGYASTSLNLSDGPSHDHRRFKKLRISLPEQDDQVKSLIFPLNDNDDLHTPYPTHLTEGQVFRLESSRGLPLSPDHKFSPVPLVPPHRIFSPANSKPTRSTRKTMHKTTKRGNESLSHRTSSRSLKENIFSRNSRSASKSTQKSAASTAGNPSRRSTRSRSRPHGSRLPLASPFASQPSSPHSQTLHTQPTTKPIKISNITIANSKRILLDTHYNPNIPQAQSTSNSPTRPAREAAGVNARRPSAPSATSYRPDVATWFVSPVNQGDTTESNFNVVRSQNIFDLMSGSGGRGFSVDFNRPPSQLSFNSAYDEDFFGDAQSISTPFGFRMQDHVYKYAGPMESSSSEDEDEDRYLNRYVSRVSRPQSESNANQVKPDNPTSALSVHLDREHSTWITDSLISAPTALCAYSRSKSLEPGRDDVPDVHMLDDDNEAGTTLGLGSSLGLNQSPCFEDTLLRYDGAMSSGRAECAEQKAETLKELFEGLDIAYDGPRPALTRSRSLDLDSLQSPPRSPITTSKEAVIQVQPLESPVFISPSKSKLSNIHTGVNTNKRGTRDRRGTIRASDFAPVGSGNIGLGGARRTRSGTIVGPTGNRRERSGTIIAATRPTGLSAVPHRAMDVDMQLERPAHDADVQISDCDRTNLKIGGRDKEDDIAADPMNIVGHWRDEDWPWAVAEPPSPLRPRQTRAENTRRRLGLGLGLKMPKGWELWKMREHEEDGHDDPLNLLG